MNPIARRANIFCENLPTEVVLYNKLTQEVHCLNKTVAIVWENADGTRSVDQLSRVLEQRLSVSSGRDLVLGALAELSASGLLENVQQESKEETVSRRNVARKFAMAGMSVAVLPMVASMLTPTAAMAACTETLPKAEQDEGYVASLLNGKSGISLTYDPANPLKASCTLNGATGNLSTACTDFNTAISDEKTYNSNGSTTALNSAYKQFTTAGDTELGGYVPNVPVP